MIGAIVIYRIKTGREQEGLSGGSMSEIKLLTGPNESNTPVKHGENKGHRWRRGQSDNPHGRPKKDEALTPLLRSKLEEVPEAIVTAVGAIKTDNKKPWKELIAENIMRVLAFSDNPTHLKIILDRIEGPVAQSLELEGKGSGPVHLMFIPAVAGADPAVTKVGPPEAPALGTPKSPV